jgi:hypothetical protein
VPNVAGDVVQLVPSPAVCVPAPPDLDLTEFIVPPVVQEDPLYSSDAFVEAPGGSICPPKTKAAVLLAPKPVIFFLAVLRAGKEVQLVPLYEHVAVVALPGSVGCPPAENADV